MSGTVLTVTLLAGAATLGASFFLVRGEAAEIVERKADERFFLSKQPYDFTLTKAGVDRLRTLRGRLLMTAVADPRFTDEMLRLLPPAALAELARSRDDVPALLRAATTEARVRPLVARLADTLRADDKFEVSGQVAAWVLLFQNDASRRELLERKLSDEQCADAARAAMDLCVAEVKYRGECRRLVRALVEKRPDAVGGVVAAHDAFLQDHIDSVSLALLMPYVIVSLPSSRLANLRVVKHGEFSDDDIALIRDGLAKSGPESARIKAFMQAHVMPKVVGKLYSVTAVTRDDPDTRLRKVVFSKVGQSAQDGQDDTVVSAGAHNVILTPTVKNEFSVEGRLYPSQRLRVTIARAFDYSDVRDVTLTA